MRTSTVALKTLLDNWGPQTRVAIADLYTIVLVTGETFRWSGFGTAIDAPAPGTSSPNFHYVVGPRFRSTKTSVRIGVEVSELLIDILVGPNDSLSIDTQTIDLQKAVWSGLFDGAYVWLQRAYLEQASNQSFSVVGTVSWFYGHVSEAEAHRQKITLHVKSTLDLMNVQMPRRVYQSSCGFVFGGPECTFDRTTRQALVTAASGSNQNQIQVSGLVPSPTTLYDNGTLISTSGANSGFKRSILTYQSSIFFFLKPWIFPVTIGDTFTVLPGCDHTFAGGCTTFFGANAGLHFGGFQYIPPPESAV